MAESRLHRYEAAHAVVTWDAGVCRHAAECVRCLPAVFDPKAKPWIAVENASFDALAAAIARCPSGALRLYRPDGTLAVASAAASAAAAAPAPAETVLRMRPNGPNVISGDVVVAGARGAAAPGRATVVLCRCGASGNKPYCDGTHNRIGFRDPGLLPPGTPTGARALGKVTVTPTPNGPLECVGHLVVESADGRIACSEETWLCRCGHSRTKPFCDRSHERVGFVG